MLDTIILIVSFIIEQASQLTFWQWCMLGVAVLIDLPWILFK